MNRENATLLEERTFVAPLIQDNDLNHLKNAQTFSEWTYQQKVKELNTREKNIEQSFAIRQIKLAHEEDDLAKNLIRFIQNDAYGCDEPLSEEVFFFYF